MTENVVLSGDLTDWTAHLPNYQRKLIGEVVSATPSLDCAVELWLSGAAGDLAPFGAHRGQSLFLQKFLDEVHDLLCSPNRYQEERAELARQSKGGQAAVVGFVAAVISPILGAAAPIIVPAIAIVMVMVARMGLNAWCAVQAERRSSQAPPV